MEGKSTEDIAREAQKQAEDLIWIKVGCSGSECECCPCYIKVKSLKKL